jgi:hypothetical protein
VYARVLAALRCHLKILRTQLLHDRFDRLFTAKVLPLEGPIHVPDSDSHCFLENIRFPALADLEKPLKSLKRFWRSLREALRFGDCEPWLQFKQRLGIFIECTVLVHVAR